MLDTPEGETAQADTGVMQGACHAPAAATGGLGYALKAKGHEQGTDACDKRLPVAKEQKVGRFIVEIAGAGPVFTGLVGRVAHGHPRVKWSRQLVTQEAGNASPLQEERDGVGTLPLKSVECGIFRVKSQGKCRARTLLLVPR
jgi:hypothetical protein